MLSLRQKHSSPIKYKLMNCMTHLVRILADLEGLHLDLEIYCTMNGPESEVNLGIH